ncbi:glycosyltransferase [filamentous cyanobacterium CCP5]|nr:glycosyltransferase [filamentous cyanobacterium CCP5]
MGLPVHWGPDYSAWMLHQYRRGCGLHVVTLNAEMAIQAEQLPQLGHIIQTAELVIPDGAGVVLYFRIKGKRVSRAPGIEVAEALLHQLTASESVFLFGGGPGIAQQAADHWRQRSPQLAIAGVQHGYLDDAGQSALLENLVALQPSVILVGLGVPRQEYWIAQYRHLCPKSIWIGVGGSFDIWAGTKTRAPAWMGNNHLEWLYRLYQEPWRWRRMLALPRFAWKALTYRGSQA